MQIASSSSYVSLGDRHLHYQTAGDGPVTVLFEAGMGRSRSTWALVQQRVAEFAHTVVYDRAGHGLSDSDPEGRDVDRLLSDHLAVVDAVADRPTIGVGHSYGGPLVRMAAARRPGIFHALTLVDEVSETCEPHKMMAAMRGASIFYGLQVILAKLGILAPLLEKFRYRQLDESTAREAAIEGATMASVQAARAEWQSFEWSFEMLHDTGPHVPQLPLTTISTNRSTRDGNSSRDFLGRSHDRIADLSPRGRHIYSSSRNHNLHLTDPDLVVAEIRTLVDQVLP